MEFELIAPYVLAILFFVIAFIYSSVGLGGGSSYTALMAIFGISALAIPVITFTLNIVVTTVGSFNFIRNKHGNLRLIVPFLVTSIPMVYIGGALKLPGDVFYWVLLVSLMFVAARIYIWHSLSFSLNLNKTQKIIVSLISGGVLGLVAGITGIGGGVYLVPLIIILGLGTEKQAAACGAIFIWVNSCVGLVSRLEHNPIDFTDYLVLIIAVLAGGILGSFMGSFKYSAKSMEKILGFVILMAILFLSIKVIDLYTEDSDSSQIKNTVVYTTGIPSSRE